MKSSKIKLKNEYSYKHKTNEQTYTSVESSSVGEMRYTYTAKELDISGAYYFCYRYPKDKDNLVGLNPSMERLCSQLNQQGLSVDLFYKVIKSEIVKAFADNDNNIIVLIGHGSEKVGGMFTYDGKRIKPEDSLNWVKLIAVG